MKNHLFFIAAFITLTPLANAQVKDTTSKAEEEDFSAYADANEKPLKRFVGQKILWQTPAKLVSVGYEYQSSFDLNNSHGGVDEA
jgi:hypothetical protein